MRVPISLCEAAFHISKRINILSIMNLHTWLIFAGAVIVLTASPGPNALLALSHGVKHGLKNTFATICGSLLPFIILRVPSVLLWPRRYGCLMRFAGSGRGTLFTWALKCGDQPPKRLVPKKWKHPANQERRYFEKGF